MAREPGKQLDLKNTLYFDTVIRFEMTLDRNVNFPQLTLVNGLWIVELELSRLHLAIEESKQFQVFIHLPKSVKNARETEGVSAVIKDSLTNLTVRNTTKMDNILVVINRCPTLYDYRTYDPGNVVKAVNPLICMGKDKAIQQLLNYELRAGYEISRRVVQPENSDTASRWCIEVIGETIFENYFEKKADDNKFRAIIVHEGIPFRVQMFTFTADPICNNSKLLTRMQREGKMLNKELITSSNPLRTAEALFQKLKRPAPEKADNNLMRNSLREQAWLMVKPIFPEVKEVRWTDELLNERINMIDAKGLKWNMQRNEYEVIKK